MKKLLICILLLAAMQAAPAFTRKGSTGRTIATNGSQSDVQQAVDSATDGSTVTIPSGTFDWTGQLNIKKAITLAGNGVSETTIRNQNGGSNLINATSAKTGNIQIYGISFLQIADNGGGRGFCISAGRDVSTHNTVLIHDCQFDLGNIYAYAMLVNQNGVIIYNCSFRAPVGLGGISFVWEINNYELYNTPSTMGTADPDGLHNSYVEDCTFGPNGNSNMDANSRTVWRHNTFHDGQIGSHGQETSPNGVRHWEIYDNTFRITKDNPYNLNNWVQIRGGTGVFTGNDLDEIPWGKSQFQLNVFSITRSANDGHGGSWCPIEYPAPRQTGWGWADNNANWGKVEGDPSLLEGGRSPGYFLPNGKGAILEPVYVWGNTGAGTKVPTYVDTQTYQPDDCGNGQVISTYLKKNRDYYVDAGAKPGWTRYPYPHPMRGGGGPHPTPTPGPSATPTPQPTPTPPEPTPTPTPEPTPPPSNPSQYSNWLDQLSRWIEQHPATPNQ